MFLPRLYDEFAHQVLLLVRGDDARGFWVRDVSEVCDVVTGEGNVELATSDSVEVVDLAEEGVDFIEAAGDL